MINGYTVYRRDRNSNGGGLLLYIREDIPSSLLNIDNNIEGLSVELNVRKKTWLIYCTYNPHKNFISTHLKEMSKTFAKFSSKYDNFILLGDLNRTTTS